VLFGKFNVQDDLRQAANRYKRRGRKILDEKFDPADEPFYEWLRNATNQLDSLVTFEIRPDFGQTAGSAWATALSAAAAGMSGTPMTATKQSMEFKAEFLDMSLFRDGVYIRPVTPGRALAERAIDTPLLAFVDEAYSGMYSYSPSVFMTGKQFQIDIYDARQPDKPHKIITLKHTSKLIQQIRSDFKGVELSSE